ncbi:hypothetical protein [Streptomyces sp. NPDC088707]|uniref:hypothetical protein n=1 Tax=Streptomyces sp. NPDC088707 TaxID=3365871 RepID=UPI00381C95F1
MTTAHISITRKDDAPVEALLFGRWFWYVRITWKGSRSGFARTEARARAKAEQAAHELAAAPVDQTIRYDLPVDGGTEPTP